MGNETDKAIQQQPELKLLQDHGPERGLALLQEVHGKNKPLRSPFLALFCCV